jgi:hypothetical protein
MEKLGSYWREKAEEYLRRAGECTDPVLAEKLVASAAACTRAAEDCESKYPPE